MDENFIFYVEESLERYHDYKSYLDTELRDVEDFCDVNEENIINALCKNDDGLSHVEMLKRGRIRKAVFDYIAELDLDGDLVEAVISEE